MPVLFTAAVTACLFFFQAEDGIRDSSVTGVQTCALPIFAVICSESTTNRISSRGPGRPVAASPQGEDGIRLWQFCRCRATRCALIVRWRAESFRRNITDGVGGFAMDGSALLFGAECQIR